MSLCSQTAVGQKILEHLAAAIDVPAVGRIVERAAVGVGLIAQIGGDIVGEKKPVAMRCRIS